MDRIRIVVRLRCDRTVTPYRQFCWAIRRGLIRRRTIVWFWTINIRMSIRCRLVHWSGPQAEQGVKPDTVQFSSFTRELQARLIFASGPFARTNQNRIRSSPECASLCDKTPWELAAYCAISRLRRTYGRRFEEGSPADRLSVSSEAVDLTVAELSLKEYFRRHQTARTPSRQPIFLPSS